MKTTIIFGPPGTGKTHALMKILADEERVGFLSFTRKAVAEGSDRNSSEGSFFRTLHSLVYHSAGIDPSRVLDTAKLVEFGKLTGFKFFAGKKKDDGTPYLGHIGNRAVHIYEKAQNLRITPWQCWEMDNLELTSAEFEHFCRTFEAYKNERAMLSFSDLLEIYLDKGDPIDLPAVAIDEAQDLTPLQWAVVEKMFKSCHRMYVAGDDDQCIYSWAGADVNHMIDMEGERIILDQSYRVPRKVAEVAEKITGRIKKRQPKVWRPRDEEGFIKHPVNLPDMDEGTWLILARNHYSIQSIQEELINKRVIPDTQDIPIFNAVVTLNSLKHGIPVTGVEVSNMLKYIPFTEHVIKKMKWNSQRNVTLSTLVKMGLSSITQKMNREWNEVLIMTQDQEDKIYRMLDPKNPTRSRVTCSTIHAAKGGEADYVVLITNFSSRTETAFMKDPDPEHRVWYVAVTRARKGLYTLNTNRGLYYNVS